MQPQRIVLAGGYTAGHIHPLVAVAREFGARNRQVMILGDGAGPEAEIVRRFGLPFRNVAGAPLSGVRGGLRRARAYAATAAAVWAARRLLREAPVALVAGFGGYVSAAPIIAARSLGIPTAIFEANAVPGLANRQLRRIATVAFAGLATTTEQPGWSDAIVSGHPILAEILRSARPRAPVRTAPLRVLVTAGLRGSAFLNAAAPALAAELHRRDVPVVIHHQSGSPATEVASAYARHGIAAAVEPFIVDMSRAYADCDLVVCAGGAGTLAELAALGLPALVVPIAATADDHQTANARACAARPRTACVSERDFDPVRAAETVLRLARTEADVFAATGSAAAVVVDHCEQLIERQRPAPSRYRPIERASC